MSAEVELLWLEGRIERWLRFGRPFAERELGQGRRLASFAPGAIFCLARWRAGTRGAIDSRIAILRVVGPGEGFTTYPHVAPGAEILLDIAGWARVQAVLETIDAVEGSGLAATAVAPDYWRHVGARIAVGLPPRGYTRARHRAWRLRRSLTR